jgi:phenylalanyl-tRNA synthetase beta subunit
MAAIGWQEIYSYSMVSEKISQQTEYTPGEHLKLQNPLTEDRVYLRRSLIPSLAEVIEANPLEKTLSVFEIANLYHKKSQKELPNEELHLTLVSTEKYRKVRGNFETLLDQFFVKEIKIDKSGNITADGVKLGRVTLDQKLVAIDIEFSQLLKIIKTHPTYVPISKTGFIREDLTFTIEDKVALGELITLLENQSQLITKVALKDQFKNNYTFKIEYHDDNKNLSGTDVEPLRRKIIHQAENFCDARLVGNIE